VYQGTHASHSRITARSSTKISELQIAFERFDASNALIDVVMKKTLANLEML
jgi:hypothetical protein